MTKQEIINYMYENHVQGDFKIEEMAEDLAQPERKTGKITYTKCCEELWGQSSICSLCGCSWQIANDGNDNFCPNCGCRMEEGEQDE